MHWSSGTPYSKMHEQSGAPLGLDNNLEARLTTSSTSPPWAVGKHGEVHDDYGRKSNLNDLADPRFYRRDGWFMEMCEVLFKLSRRNATIKDELYYGVIHYISCLYCLAVVPQQMSAAGYDSKNLVVAVALCSGVGSIFCGLFANLPFVLAPPTVVSIFLSVFLQQEEEGPKEGSIAVLISGALLMLFGWRPLGRFTGRLIPISIQVGTAVGIGLLTALAGSTEVDLVQRGEYTVLKIGPITPEICIVFAGVIIVAIATNYHLKGAFCIAVIFCSVVWWLYDDSFPSAVAAVPKLTTISFKDLNTSNTSLLTVDLIFLYVLYLNGLMTSLSNLAVLTREDSTVPRGRWIPIVCGAFTIISGLFNSVPILISPESASSIKAGAKTGLSAVVAGVLFLVSLFFSPLFEEVPGAGTSPVLIMIGVILFQNVSRIDWRNVSDAAPAFVVLFYIPFTYSIIQGVIIGYVVYLTVALFNGQLLLNVMDFVIAYLPFLESWMLDTFPSLADHVDAMKASSFSDPEGHDHNQRDASHSKSQQHVGYMFDEQQSSSGQVNVADMNTSGSISLPPNYNSTGHTFADFGTGVRSTIGNAADSSK